MLQMLRPAARYLYQHCSKAVILQRMNVHDVATQALEKEVQEIKIPVPWGHIAGIHYTCTYSRYTTLFYICPFFILLIMFL